MQVLTETMYELYNNVTHHTIMVFGIGMANKTITKGYTISNLFFAPIIQVTNNMDQYKLYTSTGECIMTV